MQDESRPLRVAPTTPQYRVMSLALTAGKVRRQRRKAHEKDASKPAPSGHPESASVWFKSDACPYARSSVFAWSTADGRRSGDTVDPAVILRGLGLPGSWLDADPPLTVPAGAEHADELREIAARWNDPATRSEPRANRAR